MVHGLIYPAYGNRAVHTGYGRTIMHITYELHGKPGCIRFNNNRSPIIQHRYIPKAPDSQD